MSSIHLILIIIDTFERVHNTWEAQMPSRQKRILSILRERVMRQVGVQSGDINNESVAIPNKYNNSLDDLEGLDGDTGRVAIDNQRSPRKTTSIQSRGLSQFPITISSQNTKQHSSYERIPTSSTAIPTSQLPISQRRIPSSPPSVSSRVSYDQSSELSEVPDNTFNC